MIELTDEQKQVIDATANTTESLHITAYAGSGKTETLVRAAAKVESNTALCVAFNKSIALELEPKVNHRVSTMHALGFSVWAKFLRTQGVHKVSVDPVKMGTTPASRLAARAKAEGLHVDEDWSTLTRDEELIAEAKDALRESIAAAHHGDLDFGDMLYMPILYADTTFFPKYPTVFVDETQDLGYLEVEALKRVASGRLIFFGDEAQCIYAWRGALPNVMPELGATYDARHLKLTRSFRCPRCVVEHQTRIPDMVSYKEGGSISIQADWTPFSFPDGSAIICRRNAPLVKLGIAFILAGRPASYKAKRIGPRMSRILRNLGPSHMPTGAAVEALTLARTKALMDAAEHNIDSVSDLYDCVQHVLLSVNTLGDAQQRLRHLTGRGAKITLTTGHGAKGLEWNDVYLLDMNLLSGEEDENLRYVMQTRTLNNLTYITSHA